ncbi:hypothetical protein [uncultured Arcobacter sp.]|uniref:hypothetical protein n=1 Tax=uncultured Arcobacter sp. TaxID=165434 RepID=UPI0026120602|nr:hypothetical protein [uncultured Arcobacter sp.]
MTEENIIQLTTVSFPQIITVETASLLLNETITEMQREGYTILSVNHDGGNKFIIEYRRMN